jgi:hypothetical protein
VVDSANNLVRCCIKVALISSIVATALVVTFLWELPLSVYAQNNNTAAMPLTIKMYGDLEL